jgi:hypothetical protein
MYFANYTRPYIIFAVNLLARYSSTRIIKYTRMSLNIYFAISMGQLKWGYFDNESNSQLIEYADAGYFFDPHKRRLQTCYLFIYGGTPISWRFVKQTLVAASSNHSEIIAIHEAS